MKYIFGPVPSRRLGLSLGVDLVPHKVCSFDCVYCECGNTTLHTTKRDEYVPVDEVLRELEGFLSDPVPFHYITFSGFGEPTLNSRFGEAARWIKEHVDAPLALLTNSSLFVLEEVRGEASSCDLVLPSLDAVTQSVFERINRPVAGIKASDIVRALRSFRREHPSVRMELEILFVKGFNDTQEELSALKSAVEYIEPHAVHLNTVDRPPAEDVEPVGEEFLLYAREFFGDNCVVVGMKGYAEDVAQDRLKEAIVAVVKRRPLRSSDIAKLLGEDIRRVAKFIDMLEAEGLVERVHFDGSTFWRATGGG